MIWPTVVFGFFAVLGCRDYFKSTHPVRANYPLMGRLRYLLESIRPELRQLWESDTDETPYHETASDGLSAQRITKQSDRSEQKRRCTKRI